MTRSLGITYNLLVTFCPCDKTFCGAQTNSGAWLEPTGKTMYLDFFMGGGSLWTQSRFQILYFNKFNYWEGCHFHVVRHRCFSRVFNEASKQPA